MPKQKRAFKVLRGFDAVLSPNRVRAVAPGTILRGAPRSVTAKGNALKALEQVMTEEKSNGQTDDV